MLIQRSLISENPWNPNAFDSENYPKLVESIRERGIMEPLKVMPDPARAGEFLLVDGYHRWKAAGDLGLEELPCEVWDITVEEAKIRGLQLNYLRGQPVPQRLASLVHDLSATYSLQDLGAMLPWSDAELRDCLELLRLPADIEGQLRAEAAEQDAQAPVPVTVVLIGEERQAFERAMAAAKRGLGRNARRGQCLAEISARYLEAQGLSHVEAADEH